MADIMIGEEPDLTYNDWLNLIDKNSDQLYIQSKYRKLHIKIENNIFELYFFTILERQDYFRLLELCSSPVKVTLENIQEHSHTEIDSYFGVSANFHALEFVNLDHDIFYVELIENTHIHSTVNINLDSLSIIEKRKDYIYFRIDGIYFEAKELVGNYDLYYKGKQIATATNKNEVIGKAQSYMETLLRVDLL